MSILSSQLPALQVVIPLATAPLAALLHARGLAWAVTTAASLCAFAIAILLTAMVQESGPISYAMGSWLAPYGIELVVDHFTSLLLLVVTGASSVGLLLAPGSLQADVPDDRQHLFYSAWLLALAGLSGIVLAGDAFNIFVFMEISSLSMYILIAAGAQRQALSAVFRYLIMGTIGATLYLVGVGLIYMMTGTLNMADMAARIPDVEAVNPLLVAACFIVVGLTLKAAVFPLHSWLPNAYTWAPHAVTVFIAACATKVSLYVLIRFDFAVFQGLLPGPTAHFVTLILPFAILATLVASALALQQSNLKSLLAYSSVAQIGYILFGVGLLSMTGLTAGIVHVFNHALAKGALFVALLCLASRGTVLTVAGVAGVARRMPLTFAAFVIAGLSLIGLPGTAGFISKWYLVQAALEQGPGGLLLILPLLVSALLAVLYIWKVVESAWFRPADEAVTAESGIQEAPPVMLIVLWGLVALNIYFGVQPALPLDLATEAARGLLEAAGR